MLTTELMKISEKEWQQLNVEEKERREETNENCRSKSHASMTSIDYEYRISDSSDKDRYDSCNYTITYKVTACTNRNEES